MRNRAIVSGRGTVTIPGPVRVAAGIYPGDLIEFAPQKDRIILKHLVVKDSGGEAYLSGAEWNKLDEQVRRQVKSRRYKSYTDLDRAKQHSRNLARGE